MSESGEKHAGFDDDAEAAYELLDEWGDGEWDTHHHGERMELILCRLLASACTRGWLRYHAERRERARELALREREVIALEMAAGLTPRATLRVLPGAAEPA